MTTASVTTRLPTSSRRFDLTNGSDPMFREQVLHNVTGTRSAVPPTSCSNVGFCAQGFDSAGWFRRLADADDPRVAFIFDGVDDETFGRLGTEGGAAGQEIDRYDPALGSPPGTLVLATSEGLSEGFIRAVEEVFFLVAGTTPATDPFVRADLTYSVDASGGAMFTTRSISWCGSLGEDIAVSRITRNVIERFVDPSPLPW